MKRGRWIASLAMALVLFAVSGCGGEDPDEERDDDQPQLSIPANLELSAQVGESTEESVQVANDGGARLTVDFSHDADWLDIDPSTVDVDAEDRVDVVFEATCHDSDDRTTGVLVGTNEEDAGETVVDVELECMDGEPETGTLVVAIGGLPSGIDADIAVEGPGGFDESITSTETFTDIGVGDYTVTADEVEGDEEQFAPVQPTQSVQVEADSTAEATVEYELQQIDPGTVAVVLDGLPDGAEPTVELVDGGDQVVDTITGDGAFDDVAPGEYTVVPGDYDDNGVIYRANDEDVVVESGETTDVDIEYLEAPGQLEVDVDIPASISADFVIEQNGDDAYDFSTTGPTTETIELEAGSYQIVLQETVEDQWGNEVIFEGVGESFNIESDGQHSRQISADKPTLVTTEVDDADTTGSLREVLDRVERGSEVTFDTDEVDEIALEEMVILSKPVSIIGPADDKVVLTQAAGSSDRLFLISYDGSGEDDSDFLFQDLIFEDATASFGTGIRLSGNAAELDVIVFECEFQQLEADNGGGAAIQIPSQTQDLHLRIQDSEFVDNAATVGPGGAIRGSNAINSGEMIVDIDGSIFHNNDAEQQGGAIFLESDYELVVNDSEFVQNTAGSEGGALFVDEDGDTELVDTVFDTNSATDGDGGAIWIGSGEDLHLRGVEFESNVGVNGGAAYLDTSSDSTEVSAVDNVALEAGGAFFFNRQGDLRRSEFRNNEAEEGHGGAIRFDNAGGLFNPIAIESVLFEENSANQYWGGAISVYSSTINLRNSTFSANAADGFGGAIYMGTASFVRLNYNTFIDNRSDIDAASILYDGSDLLEAVTMRGNYFAGSDGIRFVSNEDNAQSEGYNVFESDLDDDYVDTEFTDMVDADTDYEELDGDGSHRDTHALALDSPGYLDIPADECTDMGSGRMMMDQRGGARPAGTACSVGAREVDTHHENFEDADLPDDFGDGSFDGVDDRTWSYVAAKETDVNTGAAIYLEEQGSELSSDELDGIDGDIEQMAIYYRIGGDSDDGNRRLRVRADGDTVASGSLFDDTGLQTMTIDDFDDWSDADTVTIQNNSPDGEAGIIVEQITWR